MAIFNWMVVGEHLKISIGLITVTVTIVSTAGFIYLYRKRVKNLPPKKWIKVGELSELLYYPIKSCAPIQLTTAECQQMGLIKENICDRIFMVTEDTGKLLTARAHPKLVLVQSAFENDENGQKMIVSAPEMKWNLEIDLIALKTLKSVNKSSNVQLLLQPMEIVQCEPDAARWFSQYLFGKDNGALLVFNSKQLLCNNSPLQDPTSFTIVNQASVNDLNSRIDYAVTPQQFRPNFVVNGADAFAEDNWKWIRIGEQTIFRNLAECNRCIFVNIDPFTGARNTAFEPLKTLRAYRKIQSKCASAVMGAHLSIRQMGDVNIGDEIYSGCN